MQTPSDVYQSSIFGPPPFESPHLWQKDAIEDYFRTDGHFLADATPGSGKTGFAAYLFRRGYGTHWQQIVVVTNAQDRRKGWVQDLSEFGINVMENWGGRDRQPTLKGYHGSVVTYNILPGNEMDLQAICRKPTLVVFDEIHHLGDALSWGRAAKNAFDIPSVQTVGLTGTPFRSDDHPIPFVEYEPSKNGSLKSKGHVGYSYGNALRDGVLRPIYFRTYDGTMEWQDADGEVYEATFEDDIPEDRFGGRLRTAIVSKEWVMPSLKDAHKKLMEIRAKKPDAGGLIIAKDQYHASKIFAWMQEDDYFNSDPALVISDDSDAQQILDAYRNSNRPWIIAVRMISEGVNMKRLRLGFYASNVVAPLFIYQVIGRVLRGPAGQSWFWFPQDPRIVSVLDDIREMRDHVIESSREVDVWDREEVDVWDREEVDGKPLYKPIAGRVGEYDVMGPVIENIPTMSESELALLPQDVLARYITSNRSEPAQQSGQEETLFEREERLRKQLNGLAATVAARIYPQLYRQGGSDRGRAISKIHHRSNTRAGITSTDSAPVDLLEHKKTILLKMMGENNGR